MNAAHEQTLKHTRNDAMAIDSKKPTKRAKSPAPTSALKAEKQALKEEKAARKARVAALSKEEKEAKKAERASKRVESAAKVATQSSLAKTAPASVSLPSTKASVVTQKQTATPRATASERARARRTKEGDEASSESTKRTFKMPSFDMSPQGIASWAGAHRLLVGILIAVVFVIIFLYPPISTYYAAWRTNTMLSEQLAEVTSSVEELSGDVSKLTSEEGIKDEARRRGYVEDGDTAVDMEGIEDSGSATSDTTVMEESQEVETETPWYFVALDFIFRYNPETQGVG